MNTIARQICSRQHPECTARIGLLLALVGSFGLCERAAAIPDTIYVNNAYTGSTVNGTITYPYKKITAALTAVTGGPDTVLAVMGSNIPYREDITIGVRDSGTVVSGVVHPFVLFARGNVTLDGGESPPDNSSPAETDPNWWTLRYASPTSTVRLWTALDSTHSDVDQVIMHSSTLEQERRYTKTTDSSLIAIPVGRFYYHDGKDSVFANFDDPTHSYHSDGGWLCTRRTLWVRVPNVVINGFKVLRSNADGIRIYDSANHIRNVTITNCTIKQSTEDGIEIERGSYCIVQSNTSTENTKNGIFVKTSAGGAPVENCTVSANTCYLNNNHSVTDDTAGDDINGIRIGNKTSTGDASFGNHTIAGNRAYSNEDSGIDVRGSHGNTFRYNQSWANGDHGFDHLAGWYNLHIGDLAYANGHDGFSVENNARGTKIRNCVLLDNARAVNQQDYELEVTGTARDSFVGDYNVIYRPTGRTGGCGSWSEAQDTTVVAWRVNDNQVGCEVRCPMPDSAAYCFGTIPRFASAPVNPGLNELHSKQGEAKFVDLAVANFRPYWASAAIDGADTTATAFQATDLTGYARHDCQGKANSGNPAEAFADIGPLEYSDGMSVLGVTAQAYNTVSVNWTGSGRYGNASWKPIWYKVYADGNLKKTVVAANMGWPGSIVESVGGLSACTAHNIHVEILADSLTPSHKDLALSNTVTGETCCSPGCSDRPELSAKGPRVEGGDHPLALEWLGRNPSRGEGLLSWSIPRARAGTPYDLSLFDVAGRRVSILARGAVEPGKFTQDLSFRARNGAILPSGVFFLRLKVGNDVLKRTVVLAR